MSRNSKPDDLCSICSLEPEDLLILQCRHNLCVECATQVYALNPKEQVLTCQICLMETVLDSEAIRQLRQLSRQQLRIPDKQKPPKPSKSSKNKLIKAQACQQHNQQLLYYCFDCETFKICSECILTAKHQNHKVSTIKKAMKTIGKKINQHSKLKQQFKSKLLQRKQNVLQNKQDLQLEISERKTLLKSTFDEIVKIVSDKYTSLVSYLDQTSQRNIQIMNGCIAMIDQKIDTLNQSIEFQRSLLKQKSEKQTLAYYANLSFENDQLQINEPNRLIGSNLMLYNGQTALMNIRQSLDQIQWIDQQENIMNQASRRHKISQDFSVIGRQDFGVNRPALKQSQKSMNYSYGGSNLKNNNPSNSRKLELSRSISNATNIINKLQSRLKNA